MTPSITIHFRNSINDQRPTDKALNPDVTAKMEDIDLNLRLTRIL